jgi:hypothetical protein
LRRALSCAIEPIRKVTIMVERERETVVVADGERGGSGAVLAIVLLLAVAVILFLIFGTDLLSGVTGGGGDTNIKVDVGGGTGK